MKASIARKDEHNGVEGLLGAWPHVKDTVKVLSSPLESDKFWGDFQGRSDHPGEA